IKLLDAAKSVENKALLEKLNLMAVKLGKVSLRTQIEYKVSVIDDPGLNAFTLPNGHIYFNKGLIDSVSSDDELAAVMAHEIGHNSLMHSLRMEKKAKPLNWVSLAATLAMLTGRAGVDIAQIAPYILTGVMSTYNEEFEKEADEAAIVSMAKAGYNPSALVTFMTKLADEERRRPKVELGIFQTHPPSASRAAAAMAEIREAGLTFSPRAVEGGEIARVFEVAPNRAAVKWDKTTLLEIMTPENEPGAKLRAQTIADRINTLMRANLRLHEISVSSNDSGARLSARGIEIVQITAADAKAQNSTPLALAQKTKANFSRIFWRETLTGAL
ncbi:MAG TPA: M48 family metallopeptidase, partial [Abditibacteriaceae bacterium]